MSQSNINLSTQEVKHCELKTPKLHLVGNQVSDNLFYSLTHTPLPIQWIKETGYKIIVCLSGHDFKINESRLEGSGLTIRKNNVWVKNIKSILDQNSEAIALVSQIAKKYLDEESDLQNYKSRIFCLTQRKKWITNKLSSKNKKTIKRVSIKH